jgi:hypothetical protein
MSSLPVSGRTSECAESDRPAEAHPILLHNRKPGSDKFWTPSAATREADLGRRGSGTDAQHFTRSQRIQEAEKQRQGAPPGSKGAVGAGLGESIVVERNCD